MRELRKNLELRAVEIIPNVNKWAEGSCLIKVGGTQVICTASVENQRPLWKRLQNISGGWVAAEYSMLPRAVDKRKNRKNIMDDHRSAEISRLVGRSLRAVVDMDKLCDRSIVIDCDVIQADGGTRCAAITGGFVALNLACKKLLAEGKLKQDPIKDFVAAVSVGMAGGQLLMDLDFGEDCGAEIDSNFAMLGSGKFIEVQATGEAGDFDAKLLAEMMDAAAKGCRELINKQVKAVG
ncbi:MAG: ribonuclease PH [Rickettsiales bacterium]|nr:ribonuclease PH [Rickettsiales bacterium]